jgi:hypothetical protein
MRRAASCLTTMAVAIVFATGCQKTSTTSISGPTTSSPGISSPSTSNPPATTPTGTTVPVGTGSSGAGALPDPCSLVTDADLRAVIGVVPGPPQHLSAPVPGGFVLRLCQWSDNQGTEVSVGVSDAMPFFELAKKSGAPPIAGVGDEAFPSTDGRKLVVRRGSLIVEVEGQSASHGSLDQAQQIDLAKRAVSHL